MDPRDKEIQMLKSQNIALQKELMLSMKRCHNVFQKQDDGLVSTIENSRSKEKRIKVLNQRIEELNTLLTRSEETINTLSSHLTETRLENEKLSQDLALAHAKLTSSQTVIQTFKAEVDSLKSSSAKVETQLHELINIAKGMGPYVAQALDAVKESGRKQSSLVRLYESEAKKRKMYFDEVQTLRGNFRVFCRVRPQTPKEVQMAESAVVSVSVPLLGDGELPLGVKINETLVSVEGMRESSNPNKPSNRMVKGSYEFERVFGSNSSQSTVFEELSPLITSVVDGQNCCILAYGQTGSGKTHTMQGTPDDPGVNHRALNELFAITQSRSDSSKTGAERFRIVVSIYEIHNESVYDLLVDNPHSEKLKIKQSGKGSVAVEGLTEVVCNSTQDIMQIIQQGNQNRATAATKSNIQSSRSHLLVQIRVEAVNSLTGQSSVGKLTLVDLAGSERLSKSGVVGDLQKESVAINKSLSALGDVIAALSERNAKHIPYRNSVLTYLLQDSLGGSGKTAIMIQVSPCQKDISETINTLTLTNRQRGVTEIASHTITSTSLPSSFSSSTASSSSSSTSTLSTSASGSNLHKARASSSTTTATSRPALHDRSNSNTSMTDIDPKRRSFKGSSGLELTTGRR